MSVDVMRLREEKVAFSENNELCGLPVVANVSPQLSLYSSFQFLTCMFHFALTPLNPTRASPAPAAPALRFGFTGAGLVRNLFWHVS